MTRLHTLRRTANKQPRRAGTPAASYLPESLPRHAEQKRIGKRSDLQQSSPDSQAARKQRDRPVPIAIRGDGRRIPRPAFCEYVLKKYRLNCYLKRLAKHVAP